MENQMTKNYNNGMNPGHDMRKNMDDLRTCVRDLYELDEDNYQMIKLSRKALDEANNRIHDLTRALSKHRVRTFLGFLGVGAGAAVLFSILADVIDEQKARIDRLEHQDRKPAEDTEESDG